MTNTDKFEFKSLLRAGGRKLLGALKRLAIIVDNYLLRPPNPPGPSTSLEELDTLLYSGAGVDDIIRRGVRENQFIDFKVSAEGYLKPKNKKGQETWSPRAEYFKDLTAFANNYGGYIVIGVKEENDGTLVLAGVEEPRRLSQTLRSYLVPNHAAEVTISPWLGGVKIDAVSCSNGKEILVVRVPARRMGEIFRVVRPDGAHVYVRHNDSNVQLSSLEAESHSLISPLDGYRPRRGDLLWILAVRLPDILTFSRPCLALAAGWFTVFRADYLHGFWTYYIALWTDVLDGLFARAFSRTTGRGKVYDRWADILCNGICGVSAIYALYNVRAMLPIYLAMGGAAVYAVTQLLGVRPHSALAKARSGLVRTALLPCFLLLVGFDLDCVVATIALFLIAGVYEANFIFDEYFVKKQEQKRIAGSMVSDRIQTRSRDQ